MKFGRQAGMEGDLNAVIFNLIASNILKCIHACTHTYSIHPTF
jgi:hypothetical protein